MMRQPHHVIIPNDAIAPAATTKRRSIKLTRTLSTSSCSSEGSASSCSSSASGVHRRRVAPVSVEIASPKKTTTPFRFVVTETPGRVLKRTKDTAATTPSSSSGVKKTNKDNTACPVDNNNSNNNSNEASSALPKRTKKIVRVVRKKVIKTVLKKKQSPSTSTTEDINNKLAALTGISKKSATTTVKAKKATGKKSCLKKTAKTKTNSVSFASTLSTARYVEMLDEWHQKGNRHLDAGAYWYTSREMDTLKRDAQDDAAYWEHKAVAVAWQTKALFSDIQTASTTRNSKTKPGTTATEAEEALRGLEEQTAEGHWNAYKRRKDIVNAVLDAQDEERKKGGWRRNNHSKSSVATTSCVDDVALSRASLKLSKESTKEAEQRGLWDAKQVKC